MAKLINYYLSAVITFLLYGVELIQSITEEKIKPFAHSIKLYEESKNQFVIVNFKFFYNLLSLISNTNNDRTSFLKIYVVQQNSIIV